MCEEKKSTLVPLAPKNLTALVFLVALGMDGLIGSAWCASEALPPEVKALIGMKLPPKVAGKKPAQLPEFSRVQGGLLDYSFRNEKGLRVTFAFDEGVIAGKWPVFIVSAIDENKAEEILDIQMLPPDLLNWKYVNGEFKPAGVEGRFTFARCFFPKRDGRIFLGLTKAENNYEGFSSIVARAWEIERPSGHITPIPVQGIRCEIIGD